VKLTTLSILKLNVDYAQKTSYNGLNEMRRIIHLGRDLSVMKSFLEVCEYTRKKLGRELCEKEIKFLQWTQKRYEQEIQESEERLDKQG